MYNDGTCTSTTLADGTIQRNACPEAYGKLLGMNTGTSPTYWPIF